MSDTIQRQGDVLVIRVARPSAKLEPIPTEDGKVVLAHGEVTGHAHVVESLGSASVNFVLNTATQKRYFHSAQPMHLKHEEHGALRLPAGWYEVRIQREYERGAVRNVAD